MNAFRFRTIFAATVCLQLLGCEERISFSFPFEGEKLAIACMLSAGELPCATVSHTLDPNQAPLSAAYVSDASVLLYRNSLLPDTLKHRSYGFYCAEQMTQLQTGDTVRIEVTDPRRGHAISTSLRIPMQPVFLPLAVQDSFGVHQGFPTIRLKIAVVRQRDDMPGYMLQVRARLPAGTDSLELGLPLRLSSGTFNFSSSVYFNEKALPNDTTSLWIEFPAAGLRPGPAGPIRYTLNRAEIQLSAMDAGTFQRMQREMPQGLAAALFVPGPLAGNISNAYGWLGVIHTKRLQVAW